MKENPIISKFQDKDLKEVNEDIKSGHIKAVYVFFECKNEGDFPRKIDCGDCSHLYKKDIRRPNLFGCYVRDYIKMAEDKLFKG